MQIYVNPATTLTVLPVLMITRCFLKSPASGVTELHENVSFHFKQKSKFLVLITAEKNLKT